MNLKHTLTKVLLLTNILMSLATPSLASNTTCGGLVGAASIVVKCSGKEARQELDKGTSVRHGQSAEQERQTPALSEFPGVFAQAIKIIEFFDPEDYNTKTTTYDSTRPDIAKNNGGGINGQVCRTQDGKIGNLKSIPLPMGEVEGTGSFDTNDVGNYGCVPSNAPTSNPATDTSPNNQPTQPPQEITLTQQDLQNLPLPAAALHQDQAPHTLKNYNTNIYAQATTRTFTETIAGQTVEIKATPISYTFTYGDGTTLGPVTDPGHSVGITWDAKTPTSHQYTQTGTYHYTVTTDYRGEYRVAGERGWRVIPGSASVTSPTQSLQVWRVESGRVAEDCRADGQAWGCGPAGE